MDTNRAEWQLDMEEAAEGVELFHSPGEDLQLEKARDQAEASGWIPESDESAGTRPSNLGIARARRSQLRQAMEDLEFTIARPASAEGWAAGVESGVQKLRLALEMHISDVGSPDGLLAEILDTAPWLAASIDSMQNEHVDLRNSMDRVATTLGVTGKAKTAEIRQAVLSLLGDLAIHRQHGSDLVYDAYNVDIAASD